MSRKSNFGKVGISKSPSFSTAREGRTGNLPVRLFARVDTEFCLIKLVDNGCEYKLGEEWLLGLSALRRI